MPAPEDLLVFPAGVTRTAMTNDLPAGTSFGAMHFAKGYTVDGNAMTLTGDLTFDQSTYPYFVMNAPIILGANVKLGAATTSEYRGAIDVNGRTLTIDSYNTRLIGAVNGTGTLNVSFPGLSIENGGTFSGAINGIVDVAGSLPHANVNGAASGNGTIGMLTATQPVFLGTKTPAYTSDPHTIGTLHTQSASIGGQFFVDLVPGGVSDQLDVTGSVTLAGGSWLSLSVASGAVGAGQSFTIIANDGSDAVSGTFDGLPEGGQRSVPGGTVSISYHGGDGNDVVLTVVDAKKTWTGAVSENWSNPNNWSPAAVPTPGESLVFPAGARTSMVNDLASASVGSMDFRSSYVLSGNAITLGGDVFFDVNTPLFTCNAPLILGADVHLHYALTNDYTGAIDVNGHTLTIDSYNTTVNALLGTGTINVTGAGVRIAGSGTFDGTINGGVEVGGLLPNADVAGGSVSGAGTIGALTTTGAFSHVFLGVKNPSYSSDPHTIGTLRTQSLSLGEAQFFVDIGAASDQLIVTGSVTLNNSWLSLSVPSGSIANGQSFVIIDNDGNDPVSGTFSGLAEGATINVGGATLKLTYTGGDGNDVVLSAGSATKSWTGAQSALWSNPANWSPAAIPATGEALLFPAGAANRFMTNDLNVAVGAMDFRDSYNLGGNALALTGDVTFSAQTFISDAPLVLGANVHIGG
ncbi:MAG TPA: hypothetical protein VM733_15045, partial [Thermoanaerobaculia bacterium]|nr:hypothetical protein [Thermoanaerobaculia bacterium]